MTARPLRRRAVVPALLVASAALALPRAASAYCRTTTNREFVQTPGKPCDDVGKPLVWPTRCVGFSVQRDASTQVNLETARKTLAAAAAAWSNVDCVADTKACTGAVVGKPSISGADLGPVECDKVQFNTISGNANILVFRDAASRLGDGRVGNDLGLTTVSYDPQTGEILDTDIEILSNPRIHELTTADPPDVETDLLSVLTHEVGHAFGLAHTQNEHAPATMQATYPPSSVFMRAPTKDDACGICSIYPPSREAKCDPTPIRGLSSTCGLGEVYPPPEKKGCSVGSVGEGGAPAGGAAGALWIGAVAFVLGARRRRR